MTGEFILQLLLTQDAKGHQSTVLWISVICIINRSMVW